jgi:hypothetical protein
VFFYLRKYCFCPGLFFLLVCSLKYEAKNKFYMNGLGSRRGLALALAGANPEHHSLSAPGVGEHQEQLSLLERLQHAEQAGHAHKRFDARASLPGEKVCHHFPAAHCREATLRFK